LQALEKQKYAQTQQCSAFSTHSHCICTVLIFQQKLKWLIAYIRALQPFLLRCTLKDILTNSCTLFT